MHQESKTLAEADEDVITLPRITSYAGELLSKDILLGMALLDGKLMM